MDCLHDFSGIFLRLAVKSNTGHKIMIYVVLQNIFCKLLLITKKNVYKSRVK